MLVIGDIHKDFHKLILSIQETEEDNIIQVGDFGLGFADLKTDMEDLAIIDKALKDNAGKRLFIVRGNHDNPAYWQKGSPVEDRYDNIIFAQDYAVHNIEGASVLFVGGAVSIDRLCRIENKDYWKDEKFDYNEARLSAADTNAIDIDMVVTHSCPDIAFPGAVSNLVYSYAAVDAKLMVDLQMERQLMTRMWELLKKRNTLDRWIYGHFHVSFEEKIDKTNFICLGEGERRNITY